MTGIINTSNNYRIADMPDIVLSLRYGYFKLTLDNISDNVEKTIGAYALGYFKRDYTFIVKRIWRSDSNVMGRLKKYCYDNDYNNCTHFRFDYYNSVKEAYYKVCDSYRSFH